MPIAGSAAAATEHAPAMRAYDFAVQTSSSYEDLFGMLQASGFDAFPRGINEARWPDAAMRR